MPTGAEILEAIAEHRAAGCPHHQAIDRALAAAKQHEQRSRPDSPTDESADLPTIKTLAYRQHQAEAVRAYRAKLRAARNGCCKHGHRLTLENTITRTKGHRVSTICKVCFRESNRRSQAATRQPYPV